MTPGSNPFRHAVPGGEKHLGFRKDALLRGTQSERRPRPTMQSCTSTRMGLHPISVCGHRLCADPWAHVAGDTRRSREPTRERPRGASLVGSYAPARVPRFALPQLFRPTRFPCPSGPLARCRSKGRRASSLFGVEPQGSASGNHAQLAVAHRARTFFAKQRGRRGQREERNRARQRGQGNPLPRARTTLAGMCSCFVH